MILPLGVEKTTLAGLPPGGFRQCAHTPAAPHRVGAQPGRSAVWQAHSDDLRRVKHSSMGL
jgi:hypothetical protein